MMRSWKAGLIIGAIGGMTCVGTAMAGSQIVKAKLGQAFYVLSNEKVSSASNEITYNGQAYVSLKAIESGMKSAGIKFSASNSQINITSPAKPTVSSGSGAPTSTNQTGITFSNTVLKTQYGVSTLYGLAMNHDTVNHTFSVIVSFFDKSGKLFGTANGIVSSIAPRQKKTFVADGTGDYSTAAKYTVQVDTMYQ